MFRRGQAIVACITLLTAALTTYTLGVRMRSMQLNAYDGVRLFLTIFLLVHIWQGKVWAARVTSVLFLAAACAGPILSSDIVLWSLSALCLVAAYNLAWSKSVSCFLENQHPRKT